MFLAAQAGSLASRGIVAPRLLHHPAARFEHTHLTGNLVIERHFGEPERVQILDFGLGSKLPDAFQPHRYVRIAAELALFHVAFGDVKIL